MAKNWIRQLSESYIAMNENVPSGCEEVISKHLSNAESRHQKAMEDLKARAQAQHREKMGALKQKLMNNSGTQHHAALSNAVAELSASAKSRKGSPEEFEADLKNLLKFHSDTMRTSGKKSIPTDALQAQQNRQTEALNNAWTMSLGRSVAKQAKKDAKRAENAPVDLKTIHIDPYLFGNSI